MFVVDTSILLYAADGDSPGHDRCRELVLEWRKLSSPWYLTWGIVYEFLRVSTHPNVFRTPFAPSMAWQFLRGVLASPGLCMLVETPRHADVLGQLLKDVSSVKGNMLFDAHTVALMLEHGIRTIYTHDADFHRFPGLEVIDPL